jgi:hypothetical protein
MQNFSDKVCTNRILGNFSQCKLPVKKDSRWLLAIIRTVILTPCKKQTWFNHYSNTQQCSMGILITLNWHCCFLLKIPWKHIVVALPTTVPSIRPLIALWSNFVFKEKLHIINTVGGSPQGGSKKTGKGLKSCSWTVEINGM